MSGVQHDPCDACKGEGETRCSRCHGSGRIACRCIDCGDRHNRECSRCEGDCLLPCDPCGGRGFVLTVRFGDVVCFLCQGDGTIEFDRPGSPQTTCHICDGSGLIQMAPAAEHSHHLHGSEAEAAGDLP